MNTTIRAMAGSALLAAALAAPVAAAPAKPAAGETISFEQYRDWRMHFIEQRQTQIAAQLAQQQLPAERRAGLERQKAYYDYFAAMAPVDRDRRFRERFDQMDADHDGIVDHDERAAWHEKQQAFYRRPGRDRQAATGDADRR